MTVASVATSHCKKAMKFGLSIFRRGFSSSKCKTMAKMAVARIKLLRNKREAVVKQMRRDIALLLQSGQDATARIRVEHVIREQNIMAANEFLELFCELVVARLAIIAKQRECPADLKEGIASLIFAAPRCSDIPELSAIRDIFEKKYGKDFVSAATDLRPNAGVNRMLIEKLSVKTPTGPVKLKVMKEIAKEYQVEWDTTQSEMELLKPPEELIEGPYAFVSAASLPVEPLPLQSSEKDKPISRHSGGGSSKETVHFENTASAAEAAAESAKKAIAAAEVAAYLAKRNCSQVPLSPGLSYSVNGYNSNQVSLQSSSSVHSQMATGQMPNKMDEDVIHNKMDARWMLECVVGNAPSSHSDIKFDESDCDEEIEMEERNCGINPPPDLPAPPAPSSHLKQDAAPRVHPKLPDYESLAARFEALKYRKC